jgi:hypothetical protein
MGRTCNSTGEAEPRRRVLTAVVEGRRQRGRTKLRWEDEVMDDARKLGERNWRKCCKEYGQLAEGIGTAGRSF